MQLFADWEEHCRPAGQLGEAALQLAGQAVGSEGLEGLQAGGGSAGPAAAVALDGELLGDEVERRSWRRRLRCGAACVGCILLPLMLHAVSSSSPACWPDTRSAVALHCREAALFGGAYIASGAAQAWSSLREALPRLGAGGWGRRLFGRRQQWAGPAASGDLEELLHKGKHGV